MSNTTETPETSENPLISAFRDGSQFGRIDGMVLVSGFILRNQNATRDDIWDFVMRLNTTIKENPAADILELSALVKQEINND